MNTASEMGRDPSKGAHRGTSSMMISDKPKIDFNAIQQTDLKNPYAELEYCLDVEFKEQCSGVTAGPYLVIAVLAALLGIALWLLL